METTKIYKNWSRPDVFEVSRDMLREFAKAGSFVATISISEIVEFSSCVIVESRAIFGSGIGKIKINAWADYDYSHIAKIMQEKATDYEVWDISTILNGHILTNFPIGSYYEVWHIVDATPDWYVEFDAADLLADWDIDCFDVSRQQVNDWICRGTVANWRLSHDGAYLIACRHVRDNGGYFGHFNFVSPSKVYLSGTLDKLFDVLRRISMAEAMDYQHDVDCEYEVWRLVD